MRLLGTAVIAALFVLLSYGLFWVRRRIQSTPAGAHQDRPLQLAAMGCLAVFIAVNLSDWPGTVLADFWAQHAILAGTASTLPLVGVGYFAFEAHDQRVQDSLDSSVAATGRGGVVDHLVDIDVALALLGWERDLVQNRWPGFDAPSKPLRWLREGRDLLGRGDSKSIRSTDPRSGQIPDALSEETWRRDLADQCVRRVMAGIKEWGPILARSADGQKDLIELGQVRLALLPMADRSTPLDSVEIRALQLRCRGLAESFERRSGAEANLRSELLLGMGGGSQ